MDVILRRKQSFLLRLPPTLREHAAAIAQEEGISLNHFIGLALAEKVSRMERRPTDPPRGVRLPAMPTASSAPPLRTGTGLGGAVATPYMVRRAPGAQPQ